MSARFKWKMFGKRLRETRDNAGLGLREVCRSTGINHSTWCRAEQGKPIKVPDFVWLCDWMCEIPARFHPDIP